jgi:hypothetical protein
MQLEDQREIVNLQMQERFIIQGELGKGTLTGVFKIADSNLTRPILKSIIFTKNHIQIKLFEK